MPNAETARLIASLELKDQFTPGVNKALGGLGRLDAGINRTGGRALKAGQQIGTGIKNGAVIAASGIAFLASQTLFGIRQLGVLEKAQAQTNAVLTTTKGAAGQTADSVRNLAEKYENLNATIDDKVIQSGENLLLTFTNIRKDGFEPALEAALNLNTRLGGGESGLQNTIKLVGKALNDPIKGLGALSKAGITFSKQQTDQIKTLVKSNDLLGAQDLILAELGKRYGGAFKAEGATAEGTLAGIGDAAEDLQKTLATALFPTVKKVLPDIRKALSSPELVKSVETIGQAIADMFNEDNIRAGKEFLRGAFDTAKAAAPVVAAAAKTTFGFVQAAVGLFKQLPAPLQGLLVGGFAVNKLTGGLVTNIAGGIIDVVGKQFLQRGGTPANPLFVADVAGGLGKGVPGVAAGVPGAAAGAGLLGKAASLASKVFIVGLAAEAASLLAGPVVALGKDIHDGIFGPNGDPFSDFGKAFTEWRQGADWPFGQKNAPEWAGGTPGKVNNFKPGVNAGGLSPEERDILNDQRQKLQAIKDADQSILATSQRTHGTVQQQLKAADRIFRSNLTNAQKIEALKGVQRAIGNRNVNATQRVGDKIDAARRAQVAATNRLRATIAGKAFGTSITNIIKTVVDVNSRSVVASQTTYRKYFSTAS